MTLNELIAAAQALVAERPECGEMAVRDPRGMDARRVEVTADWADPDDVFVSIVFDSGELA